MGDQYDPNFDKLALEKAKKRAVDNAIRPGRGFRNSIGDEDFPSRNPVECETVLAGRTNAFVVLGKDRWKHPETGGGGGGFTQCAMIEIAVGLDSARKLGNNLSSNYLIDPCPYSDAAKIYITQKGNIDDYFGLDRGSTVLKDASKDRSGIVIKADHTRVVGREHVKIIAGRAQVRDRTNKGERSSTGGENQTIGRIDLIAGNNTTPQLFFDITWDGTSNITGTPNAMLQPIPKGDNLLDCLEDIFENLENLSELMLQQGQVISEVVNYTSGHLHEFGGVQGSPTGPSAEMSAKGMQTLAKMIKKQSDKIKTQYNYGRARTIYLSKFGPKYINSYFVKTT